MGFFSRIGGFMWRRSTTGLAKGPHVTRYVMYQQLADVGKTLSVSGKKALSISHSKRLLDVMNFRVNEISEANYPDANILNLPFDDNTFDFVVSDQVLEHVQGDPQAAVSECLRVLRPGGIAVHTTCFLNPVHGHPGDFWRFTPEALVYLHRGTDIINSGGWGSVIALFLIITGARHVPVPLARWHPLNFAVRQRNAKWPIVTWVVARKPEIEPAPGAEL